jgi:hypothetical protein
MYGSFRYKRDFCAIRSHNSLTFRGSTFFALRDSHHHAPVVHLRGMDYLTVVIRNCGIGQLYTHDGHYYLRPYNG